LPLAEPEAGTMEEAVADVAADVAADEATDADAPDDLEAFGTLANVVDGLAADAALLEGMEALWAAGAAEL